MRIDLFSLRNLIPAANEAALLSAVGDTPAPAAANSRVIEGKMTIPYGLWPVTITNEEGKPEKVLQRLDKPIAGRLVAAFNSLRGRLSRFVSGAAIFRGHPDYANSKDSAAWDRLGKCIGMEAGDDALTLLGDFSAAGKDLLAANEALAPSPHWGLRRTGEKQDGIEICEPVALYSVGLTPRPNIAGAAVNEDGAAVADLVTEAEREREMARLAAEFARIEADLRQANEAVFQRQAELTQKDAAILDLNARTAALQAELEALRKQMEDIAKDRQRECAAAAQTAADMRSAVVDAAANSGLILSADRETWIGKLAAGITAVNELLAPERVLKTASSVSPARIAAANSDLGGVSAAARFETVVRQRMAATGQPWAEAWNACKASHKELFNLMPNGGKA